MGAAAGPVAAFFATKVGKIITTASLFAVSAAATGYLQRRRLKAARQLAYAANAIRSARGTASGHVVDRPYGLTFYRPSPPVYAATGREFPQRAATGFGGLAARTAPYPPQSLLLAQYVLTVGAVDVLRVYIDGVELGDDTRLHGATWIEVTHAPDAAAATGNATATAFSAANSLTQQRGATDHFRPLSYLTGVFFLNLESPAFRGVPTVEVILNKGAPNLGEPGASSNLAAVVAAELRHAADDRGGTTITLDAASFRAAFLAANRTVQGVGSEILTEPTPPALQQSLGDDLAHIEETYETRLSDLGVTGSGITSRRVTVDRLRRYEFNGVVEAAQSRDGALEAVLAHAPGAELFRAATGEWKLSLPDGITPEQQQIVATVTGDDMVVPPVATWPDTSRRYNRVKAGFANLVQDYAQDEVTFPRQGSALDAALLAADDNADLSTTLLLEGAHNRYHANSIAATTLLLSRRESYRFTIGPSGFALEPGDVIRLVDDAQELDVFCRITRTRVLDTLNVELEGVRFARTDYAWYPDTPDTLALIAPTFQLPRTPATLSAVYDDAAGLVTVRWTAGADEDIWTRGYELQHRLTSSAQWETLATTATAGGGAYTMFPGHAQGLHVWRVRGLGWDGEASDWLESAVLDIEPPEFAGIGVEYVYSADDDGEVPDGELPDNAWGYHVGGTRGGRVWLPTGAVLTGDASLLVRASRVTEGAPDMGDAVAAAWRYDGVVGGLGRDGTDGQGREWIYVAWHDTAFPAASRPSNDWAYDAPGTVNGVTWHDAAPTLTAQLPYLYRSERMIAGASTVASEWTVPVVVGRYGIDGEGGTGREILFARWASDTLPAGSAPLDAWAFDSPGTVNGVAWQDNAPTLTPAQRYLFSSSRPIRGGEAQGSWSTPAIVGTLGSDGRDGTDGAAGTDGRDGTDGAAGTDGAGWESIFTAYHADTLPSNRHPINSWGFDEPGFAGGQRWYDAAPDLTASQPFLFGSYRQTQGLIPQTSWSTPAVIGHFGEDGADAGFTYWIEQSPGSLTFTGTVVYRLDTSGAVPVLRPSELVWRPRGGTIRFRQWRHEPPDTDINADYAALSFFPEGVLNTTTGSVSGLDVRQQVDNAFGANMSISDSLANDSTSSDGFVKRYRVTHAVSGVFIEVTCTLAIAHAVDST